MPPCLMLRFPRSLCLKMDSFKWFVTSERQQHLSDAIKLTTVPLWKLGNWPNSNIQKWNNRPFKTKKIKPHLFVSSTLFLHIIARHANVTTSVKWDLTHATHPFASRVHMKLCEWTHAHSWQAVSGNEGFGVLSRYIMQQMAFRPSPARPVPGEREREGENEWKRGDGWVEERRVRDRAVVFVFICLFNLQEYMQVSYFLMGSSGLCMVHRPHSIPFPILSSPSPHPAQLRLHLSPATEAPTPADPLPREKKQTEDRGGKKVTV